MGRGITRYAKFSVEFVPEKYGIRGVTGKGPSLTLVGVNLTETFGFMTLLKYRIKCTGTVRLARNEERIFYSYLKYSKYNLSIPRSKHCTMSAPAASAMTARATSSAHSMPSTSKQPQVYQIDFTAVASGKRIAATKRRVRW